MALPVPVAAADAGAFEENPAIIAIELAINMGISTRFMEFP